MKIRKVVGTALCAAGAVMLIKGIDIAAKRYFEQMFKDNSTTYQSYRDKMTEAGYRQVEGEDLWFTDRGAQIMNFPKKEQA